MREKNLRYKKPRYSEVRVIARYDCSCIRVVATTPRKDPQPNISDLRDHSQSIFCPILTRVPKKKKKKLPPLYIDQLKCGIRPPPPTLFGGPLCERTERDRDMKISGLVYLDVRPMH